MSSTITFYIARHGKTLMNTLEKVQGWCDSPLTPEGIEVAKYLGAGLRNIKFDLVYTSDLRRTRQTAQVLLKEQGQTALPIIEKEGFREACFGSYEADLNSKMWNEAAMYLHYPRIELMYDDLYAKKITNKEVMGAINELDYMGLAETFDQVEARTQKALLEIAETEGLKGKDSNILVVAHGLCIVVMLHNLGGKNMPKLYVDNATVCKVTYKNGIFNVESMGDEQYINAGKKTLEREEFNN